MWRSPFLRDFSNPKPSALYLVRPVPAPGRSGLFPIPPRTGTTAHDGRQKEGPNTSARRHRQRKHSYLLNYPLCRYHTSFTQPSLSSRGCEPQGPYAIREYESRAFTPRSQPPTTDPSPSALHSLKATTASLPSCASQQCFLHTRNRNHANCDGGIDQSASLFLPVSRNRDSRVGGRGYWGGPGRTKLYER